MTTGGTNINLDFSLEDNADAVLDAANDALKEALTSVGIEAQRNVSLLVPVDTGRLRNSIVYEVSDDAREVYIGTNVEYAPYVEMGTGIYADDGGRKTPWWYQDDKGEWHFTHGQKPAHFIRDGLANNLDDYKHILQEVLGEG